MIKPILYHHISEKKKLEIELFSKIPLEKRKAASQEFIDLFSSLRSPDADPKHTGDNPNNRR